MNWAAPSAICDNKEHIFRNSCFVLQMRSSLRVEGQGVPAFVAVAVKVENAASRRFKF